jgi:hypothetical protein
MSAASTTWTRPLLGLSLEDLPAGRCLIAPDGHLLRASAAWQRSTTFSSGESGLGSGCAPTGPETRR